VCALSFFVAIDGLHHAGMGSRKWYHLYHLRLGFIGRFRHLGEDFDENAETVSVACEDALASLIDVSIDFNMSSVSSAVSAELNRVLGRAGWTATRESTNTDATSAVLLGTLTTSGNKLLLPRLGPLVAGEIYRINSRFMVGGNVVNVFFRVIAE